MRIENEDNRMIFSSQRKILVGVFLVVIGSVCLGAYYLVFYPKAESEFATIQTVLGMLFASPLLIAGLAAIWIEASAVASRSQVIVTPSEIVIFTKTLRVKKESLKPDVIEYVDAFVNPGAELRNADQGKIQLITKSRKKIILLSNCHLDRIPELSLQVSEILKVNRKFKDFDDETDH